MLLKHIKRRVKKLGELKKRFLVIGEKLDEHFALNPAYGSKYSYREDFQKIVDEAKKDIFTVLEKYTKDSKIRQKLELWFGDSS